MNIRRIFELDDLTFLQKLVKRYPEMEYLAGQAEASPEGNQTLREDALAYQVFDKGVTIDPTAIEADRTFLGLLTLKWVLAGDYKTFTSLQSDPDTKLTRKSFDNLRAYITEICQADEDLEFVAYSLACNDLGKTHFMEQCYQEEFGAPAADHDLLLHGLVRQSPDLFPAYENLLSVHQKQSYIAGIGANLNLGQFVQGENLPFNLTDMQVLDKKSRELRLVCELFDFAGVTGHINAHGSIVMNEQNYQAFSTAIEELVKEPVSGSYKRYIDQRAEWVGIDRQDPKTRFAIGRIAALSRAFTLAQGQAIKRSWAKLPPSQRQSLSDEFNITGLGDKKAVLVYYAPALIANAVKATGDFEAGLDYALNDLCTIYRKARKGIKNDGQGGIVTVNVADRAKLAAAITSKP